jgi:DNA polymerase I-like protein with 3'-5' exonuclease and polymerase domains
MQKWYFGMCPEIRAWQEDIREQVRSRGWIENPFGYRMYYQDRYSEKLANEALAWTPQSSVGILINHALVQIDEQLPWCELLLQVHDSLNGQYPTELGEEAKREILRAATVPIQCRSGELVIPMGLKTSTVSWGACE